MFTIPRPNVIASDEGYSVEVLGPAGLLYTEGNRILRVSSELLAGPAGLVIYRDSIKSWEPPQSGDIDHQTRDVIVEKIRRAFQFRGFDIEVI